MIENLFEYSLNLIDYTYLLYFYLVLIDKKWEWKKALVSIFFISLVQFGKDTTLDFGGFSVFVDVFLATGFLFVYGRMYTILRILNALMIYSILKFTTIFFVSLAIELSVDVPSTLVFGMNRLIFSFILKCFTIVVLMYCIKPFKRLCEIMALDMVKPMSIIISVSMFGLSYVYGNSVNDESILIYTFFLTIILVFVYFLFYRYCVVIKETADYHLREEVMALRVQHIEEVEKEHQQVRKIRHDIRNQLMIMSALLREKKYTELENVLYPLFTGLEGDKVPLSDNMYIDAILYQKMSQYPDIEFKLEISVKPNFEFEGRDLISLLTNIIDNACEELYRIKKNSFTLHVKGNETQLCIMERNACRSNHSLKTDRDKKDHGLGLTIINDIVAKYNGDLQIDVQENFTIKILIPI